MRLFSYVVARDYGFAPNPFHGFCTLATCKPKIRSVARKGDWVVGIGTKPKTQKDLWRLVFVMRVTETLTFEEYWGDPRFQKKKPYFYGSRKQAYGDNIYSKDDLGQWLQANSHHSHKNGETNRSNLENDTSANKVLVSEEFVYWGGEGPAIPHYFRNLSGFDLCVGRNHKSRFPTNFTQEFVSWVRSRGEAGFLGRPGDW